MLLVTGANGQLGQELRLLLGDRALYVGHAELDITDEKAVRNFFEAQQFDFVINCAAYTAVDNAEDNADVADRINRLGPKFLAKYGRSIIQISTDYVFDGTSHLPYQENDTPKPSSVYGRTKLAGEIAALREAETAIVIRTAWMYSSFGKNFVKTMRRLGSKRKTIGVVSDQVGTPTYAADLANAINTILPHINPGMKRVYHYSNEGVASWYDFAVAIMEESDISCVIQPLETIDYPTRAIRPAFSILNKTKIKKEFGLTIPYWRDSLRQCITKLNNQA